MRNHTPLCSQGNGGSARISSLPQVTQLGREWVFGEPCASQPLPPVGSHYHGEVALPDLTGGV